MFAAVRWAIAFMWWGVTVATADPLTENFPARLSETGLFVDTATLTPADDLIPYEVRVALWSDGAEKKRWLKLPAGGKVTFHPDEVWKLPVGSTVVKHFELSEHRIETRLITRRSSGYAFTTYRWNESQSDADRLENGADEILDVQSPPLLWHYPSVNECRTCHTRAAEPVLALHTRQLNHAEQLEEWQRQNRFDSPIGPANTYGSFPPPDLDPARRSEKARAYLDVNCAHCHRPGGGAPGGADLRYLTPIGRTQLLWIPPAFGDLGLPQPSRIEPYNKELSVLWHRLQRSDRVRMPPLGTHRIDSFAVELIGNWIDEGAQ